MENKDWRKVCPPSTTHGDGRLKANLVTNTPYPFRLIYATYFFIKHGTEIDLDQPATDEQVDFVVQLLKENWCGLLEMPTFVWYFVLPRSLHAQIRTHRHWSFFSESHQLRLASEFADAGDYFRITKTGRFPAKEADADDISRIEQSAMRLSQEAYKKLLAKNCLPSLARGVLPMHINLGLMASCNLRSLFQMAVLRNCDILQGTYWKPLLKLMEEELCVKIDERFSLLFHRLPCSINNCCLSEIEQNLRVNKKDPHDPCSIFMQKFYKKKERS